MGVQGTAGVEAAVFKTHSYKNLKKDIESIGPIDWNKFNALNPVTYRLKAQSSNGQKSMGFIAQELKEHYPLLVHGSEPHLSVSYAETTALLVKAVQDLKKQVDDLK